MDGSSEPVPRTPAPGPPGRQRPPTRLEPVAPVERRPRSRGRARFSRPPPWAQRPGTRQPAAPPPLPRPPGGTHTQATATHPRVLWRLARGAVRAGLRPAADAPLPVQRFVHQQEQAALAMQLRGVARSLAVVVARVLRAEVELRRAEERLRDANLRLAVLEHRYLVWLVAQRQDDAPAGDTRPAMPAERALFGAWAGGAVLVLVAAGQAVLLYLAGAGRELAPVALVLLCAAVAGGSVAAVQVCTRSLDRLAERDGARRVLDVLAGLVALAAGAALVLALARLRPAGPGGEVPESWLTAVSGALLLLGVAVGYGAGPADHAQAGRRRRAAARLAGRALLDRRRRRELRAGTATQQDARAAVERHWAELAELAGQLCAAEVDAVQSWRQQAAVGDAAQRAVEQHLAQFGARHGRGLADRVASLWRGRPPVVPEPSRVFSSIKEAQPDWPEQVARVTAPARAALAARGLLDPDDTPGPGEKGEA